MPDLGFDKPVIATVDAIVLDDQKRRRRVYAGQPVPTNLLDAYRAEHGDDAAPDPAKAQDKPEADTAQAKPDKDKAQRKPQRRK